ncbi:hypothetical protein [Tengunoibacter tsumagoiensis]|uniref:Uncharacterized protein n=1 Tax=Tengunoibacter tsumagoiensis TaxID=2014871 RepID=A0A402A0S5_9CHLR|nr:hypothetical protein [Tengunoibacter tsumagoiensis]GCE12611.1 hypothetical protein KTT_24700 [Tengunoibacter tsumagoiensis]
MQPQEEKQIKKGVSLYVKSGAILLLFVLSIIVVACGATNTTTTASNGPVPTVTIQLGKKQSPTPPPPPFSCAAWVTETTPRAGVSTIVVNAKYTRITNGNPEGISGATALATVHWADKRADTTVSATTTPDGLATFPISVPQDTNPALVNHVTLIDVTFNGGGNTCTASQARAAYFVLLPATVTPTPSPDASATPTGAPGADMTPTPPGKKKN